MLCAGKVFAVIAVSALSLGNKIHGSENVDSLLKVLDKAIENREDYLNQRRQSIEELKAGLDTLNTHRQIFDRNNQIIDRYESFISDSAKKYLDKNYEIARALGDKDLTNEVIIRMGLIYAMNGQFIQAHDMFERIDYASLPGHNQARYAWAQLKYLENMMLSTDDAPLREAYRQERLAWRDSLIRLFSEGSDLQLKEVASRYRDIGDYEKAFPMFKKIYEEQEPESHQAAMSAKALADIYQLMGNEELQKYYLIVSSIGDIKQAVMENESLLTLAELLYSTGDIDRAYHYMQVALEDANLYNSSFKNAAIARVYPIVERSYMEQIKTQQKHLRIVMWIMAVLAVAVSFIALLLQRQRKAVTRSRADLLKVNERLERASVKLVEANLIRERYVGYFMHQCSLSVDKLDRFRINVNRKLKANKIEDAYVLSSRPLEKELDELYQNFDKAFLNLYPNFIDEFNNLLRPEARFQLPQGRLNTPVRIFALIRLGITDMTQIAGFLHYSVQTVYNYKSKVKKMSVLPPEEFEEKVKKIGTLAQ